MSDVIRAVAWAGVVAVGVGLGGLWAWLVWTVTTGIRRDRWLVWPALVIDGLTVVVVTFAVAAFLGVR